MPERKQEQELTTTFTFSFYNKTPSFYHIHIKNPFKAITAFEGIKLIIDHLHLSSTPYPSCLPCPIRWWGQSTAHRFLGALSPLFR